MRSRGSRVTRVTGQLTDGSRGSRVKKCDPLSSLVPRSWERCRNFTQSIENTGKLDLWGEQVVKKTWRHINPFSQNHVGIFAWSCCMFMPSSVQISSPSLEKISFNEIQDGRRPPSWICLGQFTKTLSWWLCHVSKM